MAIINVVKKKTEIVLYGFARQDFTRTNFFYILGDDMEKDGLD